jgi:hypothetical protein
VIILEEDLQVAPDFFAYFRALERLLDEDDSLLGEAVVIYAPFVQQSNRELTFSDHAQLYLLGMTTGCISLSGTRGSCIARTFSQALAGCFLGVSGRATSPPPPPLTR